MRDLDCMSSCCDFEGMKTDSGLYETFDPEESKLFLRVEGKEMLC